MERFVRILSAVRRRDSKNQRTLAVAKAMQTHLAVETRKFVLRILEEKILGEDRLNAVVRLQLTPRVSPLIILNDLFAGHHSAETVEQAVANFSPHAITEILDFVAKNATKPEAILTRMREDACFKDFEVDIAKTRFSEEAVASFVQFVAKKSNVPLPLEALKLFLKFRLDVELSKYATGEVDVLDSYQICVLLTKDDDLFRHCFAC